MATLEPVPREAAGQLQGKVPLRTVDQPGERLAEVVLVVIQAVDQTGLGTRLVRLRDCSRKRGEIGRMPGPGRRKLAMLVQHREPKLPDRLVHGVAVDGAAHGTSPDEAIIDQARERLQDIDGARAFPGQPTASRASSEKPP